MKPYEKLMRHWTETDAQVTTVRHDPDVVARFEARHEIRLPEDFRDYLSFACPRDDYCYDAMTDWWRLDRLKLIPQEYTAQIDNPIVARNAERYLFFADYGVWCYAWAINCGGDEHRGKIAAVGISNDHFVADSFAAFVDGYIRDVYSVS